MTIIIDNMGSFTNNLFQIVGKKDPHTKVISTKELSMASLKKCQPSALILSSGSGLPEDNPILLDIVKTFSPYIPILGISLGHLAIAQAFGAHFEPVKQIEHGKSCLIDHHQEDLFLGLINPIQAGCFHAFVVSKNDFPYSLKISSEAEDGTIMSIRHKTYPTFGVQFYPESVLTPQGKEMILNFLQI